MAPWDLKATASRPVATCRLEVGLSFPCRLCGHWGFKKIDPRCSTCSFFNSDSLTISCVDSVTQSDFVSPHRR